MYETTYVRPASLAEAIAFLGEHDEARPLSGGMTLIPTLKQRLAAPSHLVDLTRLDELRGIVCDGQVLRIGATMRHAEIAASPVVAGAIPALSTLANLIADPQVRNRGTLGGSVANNDPAADYPSAVLGLGATVITHARRIPADEFFLGTFETALEPGELLTAIEFPLPERAGYVKYRHPASGYAVVGVFVAQHAAQVRVAVTGAGTSVFRWHEAETALQADCSAAALDGLHIDRASLPDDANASDRYRAHLVETFTRRAVQALAPRPAGQNFQ
jgi:carbon-monoxide dehydrogenase medium subunit